MTATDRLPERVTIYEVGPRDGLQNESGLVPTAAKAEFEQKRGPGFTYKAMLGDRKPPLDYRKAPAAE